MLYRREAFESLTETPWDEGRVRDAVRKIVADVDTAFDADRLWPVDEWDGWRTTLPLKNLYVGARGLSGRSTLCAGAAMPRRNSISPQSQPALSPRSATRRTSWPASIFRHRLSQRS